MSALGTTDAGSTLALDLPRLIGSHACVVANAGGGKSGLIRRLLETTHGQVQHIVLDIEDEFYTLRERLDYVIAGGDGADVPATVENAEVLALATLQNGFSLIAQMNDLGSKAPAFVGRFLAGLLAAPRELWRPVLVVLDEAHRFAPSEGSTEASEGVHNLTAQGRKRGFTAVLASQRISKIAANVRGDVNNWMLGRVGQTLDRNIMADQLGFTAKEGRENLRALEPRTFWCFGPALAREPVQFRVADVETTPVRPGMAKVATPPAPEALRAILAGLASAPVAEGPVGENAGALQEVERLRADAAAARGEADAAYERGKVAGIAIGIARARAAVDALRVPAIAELPDPVKPEGLSETTNEGGGHVDRSAERAPIEMKDTSTAKGGAGTQRRVSASGTTLGPSPAALAIADLLDRINPARVTWTQAAAMTGRKATGGNFNAARKWLRESGRLIEDGELIRSAADAPAGMSRADAFALWQSVLTTPAPKMMDALARGSLTKEELGAQIGAAPRGGNFNNGVAQLRRNGVAVESGGKLALARPLPGEVE